MGTIIESYSVVGNATYGGYDVEVRTKFPVQDFEIVKPSRRGNLIFSCKYNNQGYNETLNINGSFHVDDYDIKYVINRNDIAITIRPKVVSAPLKRGYLPELGLEYDEVTVLQ